MADKLYYLLATMFIVMIALIVWIIVRWVGG